MWDKQNFPFSIGEKVKVIKHDLYFRLDTHIWVGNSYLGLGMLHARFWV